MAWLESELRFQAAFSRHAFQLPPSPTRPAKEIFVSDRSSDFSTLPDAHRNLAPASLRRARLATKAVFFVAGMM
jgi:hypothetical protein